ncbi:ABC transporter ATP-binding protein [Loigolactobacillus coryniformis]|uniref:ABC transporter ATP-binding protein n=1 Tax=Loigolactobacillus coryniformis TaxID=1610 RepID=UPI001C5DE5D8|nr:ABC transporter ATP-binding protein [Loigolactobacillus coryniformis]MBW4802185.1 ABC transporter ATP-binding protein [Loigolactobacillus coryniformis subsp. torquens]MBW4804883.1 ABC transporter ATP-binding protein [Loigolactobacillus coryniformis subsp. torquens]
MSKETPARPPMGHGPGNHAGLVEKPQHFWRTTNRLLRYMSNRLFAVAVVLILAITSVIFQIRTPKILGEATTEIYKGIMKGAAMKKAGETVAKLPIDFDKIKQIIIIVVLMYLTSALFSFFQQFIMTRVSQQTVYQLRREFKEKMQRVPISYYDTHSNGDIMSRAVNDMDNIASTLQQSLTQAVTSTVTFVGTIWMMLTISWKLTLIALITIPLSLVIVGVIAPRSQRYFAGQQRSLGLLNNQVEENYSGHVVLKSFNKEQAAIDTFEEQNRNYYQSAWKAQFISGIIMPLMIFMNNIGYVFVAIIGGVQVTHGAVTLGNVQAFLQYMNQFSQPISQLANLMNTIQSTIASAERIFAVLDEPEMSPEPTAKPVVQPNANFIDFDHVQFGYNKGELLMNDYNLSVKKGQRVAIVGPTGAGKTTIINLLERFYDVSGGTIRLAGVDTRELSREDLRQHFAMVLQDTWLFTGTIYDNLKYGREDATDDEIMAAAKAAHVDEFVRRLPNGYNTILNEAASNISQGQRQLVTIARAFVADPEILILDEATSSVDTRTEVHIQHAMERLLANRTSFVVAHRLSTIRDADNIIVMNHGDVVETGTHDQLMAQKGFYADLYNSQFSGNIVS